MFVESKLRQDAFQADLRTIGHRRIVKQSTPARCAGNIGEVFCSGANASKKPGPTLPQGDKIMPPRLRGGAWGHPGNVQARGLNPA